jgi:cytidylate kinase
MEMYGDTKQEGIKNIEKADKARAHYYKNISGLDWGKPQNYNLCIDSSIGNEETANVIYEYIKNISK